MAQGGRRRGPAAALGGVRAGGRCRSSPCSWTPRIDTWSACEGSTVVREALGSPVASNRGETELTCAADLGEIPAIPGLGSRLGASVGFLTSRRGSWGGQRRLGCAGVVGARWRRGSARRWRGGASTLGCGGGYGVDKRRRATGVLKRSRPRIWAYVPLLGRSGDCGRDGSRGKRISTNDLA